LAADAGSGRGRRPGVLHDGVRNLARPRRPLVRPVQNIHPAGPRLPETRPQILGIIIGSTIKGLIVGALVGWYATRVNSLAKGLLVGLLVSAFFAFLIAAMPNEQGGHYGGGDHGSRLHRRPAGGICDAEVRILLKAEGMRHKAAMRNRLTRANR
jgi:hypothetical protein